MSHSSTSNPFDPKFPGFGGLSPMMEQMEAFKRLWSSMDGSSRLVPTLDVEELDKRITDLKAVEQWLNLNLNLLRGSIQALEIQRGTLAAVQAFGSAFQSPNGWPGTAFGAGSPFGQAAQPTGPSTASAPSAPPAASASSAPPDASKAQGPSMPQDARPGTDAIGAVPGIDPSAWWTLLQNNFQQIAQAALAGTAVASASQSAAPSSKADRPSGAKTQASAGRKTATKSRSSGSTSRPAAPKSGFGR